MYCTEMEESTCVIVRTFRRPHDSALEALCTTQRLGQVFLQCTENVNSKSIYCQQWLASCKHGRSIPLRFSSEKVQEKVQDQWSELKNYELSRSVRNFVCLWICKIGYMGSTSKFCVIFSMFKKSLAPTQPLLNFCKTLWQIMSHELFKLLWDTN